MFLLIGLLLFQFLNGAPEPKYYAYTFVMERGSYHISSIESLEDIEIKIFEYHSNFTHYRGVHVDIWDIMDWGIVIYKYYSLLFNNYFTWNSGEVEHPFKLTVLYNISLFWYKPVSTFIETRS